MGTFEAIIRVVGALATLAFVLFLAWGVLKFVNKRVPGMSGGGAGRLIKVLDRTSIGKNSTMVLVRVEDKVLLVAISEHAIEKLQEFDDPKGLIKVPESTQSLAFSSTLKDAMASFAGGGKPGSSLRGIKR